MSLLRNTVLPATAALLALVACKGKTVAKAPALPVTVAAVGMSESGADEARYAGSINADASVDVAFKSSGIVEAVTQVRGADGRIRNLQDGDPVRRGTVLAELRQVEFHDQLAEANASYRQAQADFERTSQLYENRSLSKADYDAAYARFAANNARRNQSALSLSDATLRSPIDGVILRRNVEVGSIAGPNVPAFTIANTRTVKVVFGVPDVIVSHLSLGSQLGINGEAFPGTMVGRITRISPTADPNSRVFEVEAALPNPNGLLKVGMLATLSLGETNVTQGSFVPLASVVRPAGDSSGYAVFVVPGSGIGPSTARLRRVTLGEVSGNLIGVRSGLAPGERVVVRGAAFVADGQAVYVMP